MSAAADQVYRERLEAEARRLHPDAVEVKVNLSHQDGPVIDVRGPNGPVASYRPRTLL